MITLTKEEAQQVLDVLLETMTSPQNNSHQYQREIDAMKLIECRLAEPEKEHKPQAWMLITEQGVCGGVFRFRYDAEVGARELRERFSIVPLYSEIPKREWQWLTDDDIAASMTGDPIGGTALMSMMRDEVMLTQVRQAVQAIARAIEAKLKEKNT